MTGGTLATPQALYVARTEAPVQQEHTEQHRLVRKMGQHIREEEDAAPKLCGGRMTRAAAGRFRQTSLPPVKLNSAPVRMPDGQRVVMVLRRV